MQKVSFALTPEVLSKLEKQVSLPDQAALNSFMLDALNTYLHLGQLHLGGGEFFFQSDADAQPVKLHFPFAAPPGS